MLFGFLILLVTISTSLAYPKTHIATEGGGKPTTPHQYPWIIRLDAVDDVAVVENTLVTYTGQMCGGSLLKVNESSGESSIVLTAAHCVVKYEIIKGSDGHTLVDKPTLEPIPASKRRIVAGAHSATSITEPGSEVRQIARLAIHPEWKANRREGHDIAIVKLDKPIRYSDTIKPIRLPGKDDRPEEGAKCIIAGWGLINSTASPDELYHMEVKVMDTCVKSPETGHCVHPVDHTLPSSCQGDSGGPLFCKCKEEWVQYGVLSYGDLICGTYEGKSGPSVYMNTEVYLDWINEKIRDWSADVSDEEK